MCSNEESAQPTHSDGLIRVCGVHIRNVSPMSIQNAHIEDLNWTLWMRKVIWIFACITKTCLYNFYPLKLHFYKVKLGFTGVYIIFLISARKHSFWVLVRTALPRRVPTIYVLTGTHNICFKQKCENIRVFFFLFKMFSFWRWNFLYIWIGVFS